MSDLIISVSGLRGIVGESLTAEVAIRYAAAFAQTLPRGPVVVTRDGRANGLELVAPVTKGLAYGGISQVLDGGVAATPTTGVLVRHHKAVGGIQISASHNPSQYNGLKLFSAAGRVLPAIAGQKVLEQYQLDQAFEEDFFVEVEQLIDTTSAHLALVEAIVDIEQIREREFHVLLDANHGSGSVLGLKLLESLGCRITALGSTPDGLFAHPPEPTVDNLSEVCEKVVVANAVVGFCQDPDADRLALIDEKGRYLGEEYTLAICVDHVLRSSLGPVVTNCSTSRMTEDLAHKYGVAFARSAVGEANVVDKILERDAVLGGEGNGGTIDPRVGLVRDSFVGMAMVLDAMAKDDIKLSVLSDRLPRYEICKTKIELPREKIAAGLDLLEQHFTDAQPDRLDGLRLDWADRWLLVRASNTEPIVRTIAEAPTREEAQNLCDTTRAILLGG